MPAFFDLCGWELIVFNGLNNMYLENIEMTKQGLWYFAHPYTATDSTGRYVPEAEEANFQLANQRAAELLKRGYNVYSPISHTHPIHRACPEFLANHEHALWYELDNEFISKTDFVGIILAPGWENSKGCRAEHRTFASKGRRIRLYVDIARDIEKDI